VQLLTIGAQVERLEKEAAELKRKFNKDFGFLSGSSLLWHLTEKNERLIR